MTQRLLTEADVLEQLEAMTSNCGQDFMANHVEGAGLLAGRLLMTIEMRSWDEVEGLASAAIGRGRATWRERQAAKKVSEP